MKNKILFFYSCSLVFSLLSLIFVWLTSCSSPTSTPKGNLTGVVHLEGQSDHSEITIAVYELAYLDTTIVRINSEYPHIGVIINQHTEFDHRFQSPVKFTVTNIEGNFLIEKIPVGEYNIVAIKDSFGFKYIYEFEIEKDDNQLTPQPPLFKPIEGEHKGIPIDKGEQKGVYSPMRTDADITLYAEQYLSGDITDDWVFETDHHYIIGEEGSNSTNFTPGTNLEIQPGAIIRIEPANDLIIHGTISAQGVENNMFWVTSNDGFALTDSSFNFQFSIFNFKFDRSEELLQYNLIELSSIASVSDDLISWGKFDFANTCLMNKVNNLHMQNGIFRDSQCGFYSTNVDSTFCSNLLCMNIINDSKAGIYFYQIGDGIIEKNIINDCENGIKIKNIGAPQVENNYIKNCYNGLDLSWYASSVIANNEISDCNRGFYIYQECYPEIKKNNICSEFGLVFRRYFVNPIYDINYNNINCSSYAIYMEWATNDVHSENNYFYTTDNTIIEELIYDKNDVEPSQQQLYGEVDYQPFLTQEYPNAGIQGY